MRTEEEVQGMILRLRLAKKEPVYSKHWKQKANYWIEAFDWVLRGQPENPDEGP